MKITQIKTLWPENSDFKLERLDTGSEYIFIHMLSAAFLSSKEGIHLYPAGSCICYPPHSYQYLAAHGDGLVHNWAHITGDLGEIAQKYGFSFNTVYQLEGDGFITEIMQSAELETLQRKAHADDVCSMKLEELLIKILRESENEQKASVAPKCTALWRRPGQPSTCTTATPGK